MIASRRLLLVGAIVALGISACQTISPASQPTIVIASDLPISAPYGVKPLADAIALAVAQNPTIGAFHLQYMPLDDALGGAPSAMLGVENVKHMLADSRVMGMIGPFTSYVLRDEVPRANQAQLVMLSPSSTTTCITAVPSCIQQTGPTNFFRIAAPDYKQGTAMGRFAASLGIRRVAVANEWGPTGDLITQHFATELGPGGDVVFKENLAPDETDFTSFLAQAKAAGAQAIYALADDQPMCRLGPQMKADFAYLLGNDFAPGDDSCFASTVVASTKIYATFSDVDPRFSSNPRVSRVVSLFKKQYPQDNIPIYTFAAYDCALILIDAIRRAVQDNDGAFPSRAKVLAEVATGLFADGVTGTYSFDAHGDAISPLMAIWTVTGGHWTYLQQADAGPGPVLAS